MLRLIFTVHLEVAGNEGDLINIYFGRLSHIAGTAFCHLGLIQSYTSLTHRNLLFEIPLEYFLNIIIYGMFVTKQIPYTPF